VESNASQLYQMIKGGRAVPLARIAADSHVGEMFCVDKPTAAAIRKAYFEDGEFSAAIELRRHFPGIVDNENARLCVRSIASWTPLLPQPSKPARPRRSRPSA
jgi:hypothetical protein